MRSCPAIDIDPKVSEPIHLQTAGFVQACQHLLDLFTYRSQMLLSVQYPTDAADVLSRRRFVAFP